jgi:Na+-driven multidrug efflux pump
LPKEIWRRHDREIVGLAGPAFGALIAEPLFLMVDSAIVGLGTPQLAGLGVAAAVLTTAVNVFVFLAYATTGPSSPAGSAPATSRPRSGRTWTPSGSHC